MDHVLSRQQIQRKIRQFPFAALGTEKLGLAPDHAHIIRYLLHGMLDIGRADLVVRIHRQNPFARAFTDSVIAGGTDAFVDGTLLPPDDWRQKPALR